MKVILSRKGFDSAAGGYPSPVLPDGRMHSLPIPREPWNRGAGFCYGQIKAGDLAYLNIMKQLGIQRVKNGRHPMALNDTTEAHLDPDIDPRVLGRQSGWRGLFGQCGAAQRHLSKQGVMKGDLFLFFGWFRKTECRDGPFKFWGDDFHAIFGYLQIGDIRRITCKDELDQFLECYPWASDHPHVKGWEFYRADKNGQHNTVYVASEHLCFAKQFPGATTLPYNDRRKLTRPGYTRSRWRLPKDFPRTMTYHPNPKCWDIKGEELHLDTAGRGQEFVVEANEAVLEWVKSLLSDQGS